MKKPQPKHCMEQIACDGIQLRIDQTTCAKCRDAKIKRSAIPKPLKGEGYMEYKLNYHKRQTGNK